MRAEERVLIKNLAQTAEVINTINGGMSQPILKFRKSQNEWLVCVRVPGVDADKMRIEIRDGQMFLFHIISENNVADIDLPYLLAGFPLDRRVNCDGIIAEYENGELFIHLPLDETRNGYEREVEIFKK